MDKPFFINFFKVLIASVQQNGGAEYLIYYGKGVGNNQVEKVKKLDVAGFVGFLIAKTALYWGRWKFALGRNSMNGIFIV